MVEQLRQGRLSEENHKYLHGIPLEGCTLSEAERQSRHRVIVSEQDVRLQEAKFRKAVVIVANNDARYQINKINAKAYSEESGAPLRLSVAKDVAEAEALQAEDCSKEAIPRPTYGRSGRPARPRHPLTDHVDRSDKFLLRGCCGHVHSWVWPENEQQPSRRT